MVAVLPIVSQASLEQKKTAIDKGIGSGVAREAMALPLFVSLSIAIHQPRLLFDAACNVQRLYSLVYCQ